MLSVTENTTPPITYAVFLVAGKGIRMHPLTLTTPKPLLQVAGKSLIEHNLSALPATVTDIVFVIGYLGEQIRAHFGETVATNDVTRRIHYVEQSEARGTAHALFLCKDILREQNVEKFFVLMGDDIYCIADLAALEAASQQSPHTSALLAQPMTGTTDSPISGGALITKTNVSENRPQSNQLVRIDEGKHVGPTLLNAALYVLHSDIFSYSPVPIRPYDPQKENPPELGLPQTLVAYSHDHPVIIVPSTRWIHITDVKDLEIAESTLSQK